MKLFEFAVIYVPSEKSNKKALILVAPQVVLAKDASSVQLKAAKMIPNEYEEELHDVQVVVRSF
jgi:hypothetical protein